MDRETVLMSRAELDRLARPRYGRMAAMILIGFAASQLLIRSVEWAIPPDATPSAESASAARGEEG